MKRLKNVHLTTNIKTLDMEVYLMRHFDIRQNLIVPNISWGIRGINHECDLLILRPSNWAIEIEIKVSKNDILNETKKTHNHESNKIRYLYFAVPAHLVDFALKTIPERAGLLSIRHWSVSEIRKPIVNKRATKFTMKDRLQLGRLGILRLYKLKRKLQ